MNFERRLMPIYEFKCQNCQDVNEVWQKISDPYPTECQKCKKGPLEKLMSATGFTLKGQGWYVTDFRDKKNTAKTTEIPTRSETPSKAKTETKTQAKKDN